MDTEKSQTQDFEVRVGQATVVQKPLKEPPEELPREPPSESKIQSLVSRLFGGKGSDTEIGGGEEEEEEKSDTLAGYPVHVRSPAGSATGVFVLPFSADQIEQALQNFREGIPFGLYRSRRTRRGVQFDEFSPEGFGSALFRALFRDEVLALYRKSLSVAGKPGVASRMPIKLNIIAWELARLPWEFLYDPDRDGFLSFGKDTPVIRFVDREPRPYTFDPPLRILLVSANPAGTARLDLDHERIVVREALDTLKREDRVRIDHLFGATVRELRGKIREYEPHVVHFMGHGQVNRLLLEDGRGEGMSLAESSLGIILRNASSLRMAVLSACETARPDDSERRLGLAHGLARRGVPAIVAMQFEISDEAACEFAGELYRVLAEGFGVDEAVLWGRIAVQNKFVDDIEWVTPVLYMQAPEGRIFDDLLREPKAEVRVDEPSAMRKGQEEFLQKLLQIHKRNLWRLEEQKAKHGIMVPLIVEYSIDEEQAAISQILEELKQLGLGKKMPEPQEGPASEIPDVYREDAAVDVKRSLADVVVTERKLLDPRLLEQVQTYYEQGLLHFDKSEWDRALIFLEDVQRLAPGYKDVQGLIRATREEMTKQEIERRTQEKLAALYKQALTYCDKERWQEAIDLFKEIERIDPNYEDVEIQAEKARRAHARQLAEKRTRLQLETLYQRAQKYLAVEDWAPAVGLLEQILQIDRGYADASVQLADARRQEQLAELYVKGEKAFIVQNWEQAVANFGAAVAIDKSYKDVKAKLEQARQQQRWAVLYQEAMEYLEAERWGEAIEALREAQPDPKQLEDAEVALLYAEGRRYALQKELEASITSFERAMAIQPHYRDVSERLLEVQHRLLQNLYITGEQALVARQWSQAIKSFEQVAERDGGYRNVQAKLHEARQGYRWMEAYRKGLEHVEVCQWDEAITAFHSILDEGGFQEVHMARLYAAGMKHFENERWDEALTDFRAIRQETSSRQDWVESFQQPFEQFICLFQEMQSFRIASSKANQATALLRADDALNSVQDLIAGGFEDTDLVGMLLGTITEQWTSLIDEERDRVSEKTLRKPFDNPYVAGPPVDHPLFVGREEHFRRIEELWSIEPKELPSIIIYGHRRMGKSSILRNLAGHFGADKILAYFDMQRVGQVQDTGELLFNAALTIHDALASSALPEPDLSHFQPRWGFGFNLYLREVEKCLNKQRVILAVDEFELIEEGIQEGYIDKRLLTYLRGTIMGLPWLTLVFAGLHTLEEMSHDYWHPFYGSVEMIKVSYLSGAGARELITNPTEDFAIDYDQDAIETIIQLTNGQPYLVQQICRDLVSHLNHLIFDEEQEREPRITLEDVEMVMGGDFFQRGHYYFIGVWNQARENERHLLKVLSANSVKELGGLGAAELAEATGMARTSVEDALQRLEQHDVLEPETGEDGGQRWRFRVELMRRWVQQRQTA